MPNFISQTDFALKKKKKRWTPKGRQGDLKSLKEIKELIGEKTYSRYLLIEYLHIIQDKYGLLKDRHLVALSELINLPLTEVYEVSTFYAHFNVIKDSSVESIETTIRVCESLTCEMFKSNEILNKLSLINNKSIRVVPGPCMGRCHNAPVVSVGKNYIDNASVEKVLKLVEQKKYKPVVPEYISFKNYRSQNGYEIYAKLINKKISIEEIKNIVEKSGLKGKGGAGFPTSKKWEFVLANQGPRYLTINADEGEVGTFKDRYYLELDPHRFLEGVLISAKIIDAKKAFIYLRDEYPAAMEILKKEIQNLVNNNIVKKDYIIIRRGAGAYICGEESAMLESIEGKRGYPRHKPPFPVQEGLFGRPTLCNNVETLFWIRDILEKGAEWFSKFGKNGGCGFRLYSVSGRVKNPGVIKAPAGITVKELIDDYCGGMQKNHIFKSYLPGGASGGILPASLGNIPLDFGKELDKQGCFVGSGAIVIFSQKDSMRDVALNLLEFFEDESCGQCTPCRVGTEKAVKLLKNKKWDKKLLNDLNKVMTDASICGLGQAASNPVNCVLKFFQNDIN